MARKSTRHTVQPSSGCPEVELNDGFRKALEAVEAGKHVFVTGKAGTGKSTFLRYVLDTLPTAVRAHTAVVAPTGVAAVNVGGQTIHSFFAFQPTITVVEIERGGKRPRDPRLYKNLKLLIVDEISMVRADLFDCMDAYLRRFGPVRGAPMGGVQLVVIGDLYQLPPVVARGEQHLFTTYYKSPYFFDADAFSKIPFEIVELEKVYRQRDERFVDILNAIRTRSTTPAHLAVLNERVLPHTPWKEGVVHLVTTNAAADTINTARIAELSDDPVMYVGELRGGFERNALPAPEELAIAPGAQVMLTNNDPQGRWINGTMGTVEATIEEEQGPDHVVVRLANGTEVTITPHTWDMFRFVFDETHGAIEAETVGSYTQYPLMLAWAITIHKSQGKTFERVVVDMGRGAFAHGQTYVALSRATALSGLVLVQPITERHILLDWRVPRFLTERRYAAAARAVPVSDKETLLRDAIVEGAAVRIVYLKANDTASARVIEPVEVGEMSYMNVTFLGVRAYDRSRGGDTRVFRVDRILEIERM